MTEVVASRTVASPAAGDAVGRPDGEGGRLVDAGAPWYLDSAADAWRVVVGRVDLFAVRTGTTGRHDRRVPLCSRGPGEALGGRQVGDDGRLRVLAIGIPGTVVADCPVDAVDPLCGADGAPLDTWVAELTATRSSEDSRRLAAIRDLDERSLDHAETLLDGVVRRSATVAASDDDVVVAVTALARYEGLHAPRAPSRPLTGDLLARVQSLTVGMDARAREVVLDAAWWQTAGDGFVGVDADGGAVAVLPRRRRVLRSRAALPYEVVRRRAAARVPLDEAIATGIRLEAVVLQQVLPASPRRPRDLVRTARRSVRAEIAWMAVLALAASLMGLLVPITLGKVVSAAVPNRQEEAVLGLVVMLFAAGFASFVFDVVRSLTMLRLGGEYDRNLLPAVWDRVLRLPARFFRDYDVGDLAGRVVGVDLARRTLSNVVVVGALAVATLLVNALFMLAIAPKLAVPSLLVLAVFGGIALAMTRSADRYGRRALADSGRKQAMSLQLVKGVAKIRVAGATATMFSRWVALLSSASRARQSAALRGSVVTVSGGALALGMSSAAYAAAVLMGDEVTVTTFAAYAASLGLTAAAATTVATSAGSIPTIRALLDRAAPLLAAPTEDDRPGRALQLLGRVSFQDLRFAYAGQSVNVLDGFSLDVPPGSFTAIVGPSGCGKSTVLRCLMGFEQPQGGSVMLDDHDLGELDLARVRRQFGVVMQQFTVMGGTVFENIVGPRALTEADAWAAAEKVGLAAFIRELPMGMRTLIVDGAGTFSGGQAQRLMLARAIASNPTIIVLDEATSALDNPTQELVASSLAALNSTRIVIAHRLSTIRDADQIAVMDAGRVVELGRHDELMAAGGRYADLVQRQL